MSRTSLRNLGLALLIGLLFGLSPHTSAQRVAVKTAGGVLVALAAFAAAWWLERRRPPAPAPVSRGGGPAAALPTLAWVTLGLALLLFLPAAGGLYRHYTEDIWTNGHGLFVIPVVVALALATLRREPPAAPEPSAWGYPLLAAGLILLVLDAAVVTLHMSVIGFVLVLAGLSLLFLGARSTRALAFPLLLLLFLLPLPTSLAMPLGLTEATAAGSATLLQAVGLQVERNGTVLQLPEFVYGVSADCSGFSAFYAAVCVALVLGYGSRSPWRLAVLLLAAWPLAALGSIVRTTVAMSLWEVAGSGFHMLPFHGLSGIAGFWLAVTPLFLLADWPKVRENFS